MMDLAAGENAAPGKDRPLPTGANGDRPRPNPPKKSQLLTSPAYYLRSCQMFYFKSLSQLQKTPKNEVVY